MLDRRDSRAHPALLLDQLLDTVAERAAGKVLADVENPRLGLVPVDQDAPAVGGRGSIALPDSSGGSEPAGSVDDPRRIAA
jgi:hypothetical protein